ncbi:MAG: sodium:solute symporter family transporter [Candidatus Woesearchaeota archaeon]
MSAIIQSGGIWILISYAIIVILISLLISRKFSHTKEGFLVAFRNISKSSAAWSIAATWIWAPALFIAAQKAYTEGLIGLFWFVVPNVLCLIIFAYFARKLRDLIPKGFTLSGYIREKFSKRVQIMYLIELGGLAICSFAVQLLAGGLVVTAITGIPFTTVTIFLASVALIYSFIGGLKASIITDYLQMIIIFSVGLVAIPWILIKSGGTNVLISGLGGINNLSTNLLSSDGINIFLNFGLATTIGLLAGPFGDQSFWQRTFAIKKKDVKGAFIWGALIFAVVPLMMSILGFVAAGIDHTTTDSQLVNLDMVVKFLPLWMVIPFAFMLLSGLTSTLDSNLCAISSLAGHDLAKSKNNKKIIKYAKIGMISLTILATLIANIPGMKILYLFLFYGTLRASTLLPTVIAILKNKVSESGMFWGILLAIVIGLPIFAYGNFNKITIFIVIGSLLTVLLSGGIVLIKTLLEQKKDSA